MQTELVSGEMKLPALRQWCCCSKTRLLSQIYCQGTLLHPVDLPAHVWGSVMFPLKETVESERDMEIS